MLRRYVCGALAGITGVVDGEEAARRTQRVVVVVKRGRKRKILFTNKHTCSSLLTRDLSSLEDEFAIYIHILYVCMYVHA